VRRSPLQCPHVRKNRKTKHSKQMNQHLKSLAPQPPHEAPPNAPPSTPALHHCGQLKLKAPPIPTNSEQFRPNDTSEKVFLPRPNHLNELSYCSAAVAKSTGSGAWRVQYAEVERLTEGRDADHDLAVLQFSNSRAGQPNHMILKS
jgi:hypothetical protein